MKGFKKLAFGALVAGAALGLGMPKKANAFNSQNPCSSSYWEYDYHVIIVDATVVEDSLKKKVNQLRIMMQTLEDKFPQISSITLISSSGGPADRIGTADNAIGGNSTPSTALTPIMDISDMDTSGIVRGVKLKKPYRDISVEMFGESETAELECALSTLFTNTPDMVRVVYEGPDKNVRSSNEPNPYPPWLDSLDGKYVYMLVDILIKAKGITPDLVGRYVSEYDSLYKQILWDLYKLECANKAIGLAEWLERHGEDPNIPESKKMDKFRELMAYLSILYDY